MLFNSFIFIVFFSVVTILHYTLPKKVQWILLLIASIIFYMAWNPILILLLMFTIFVNYAASQAIYWSYSKSHKKNVLILSLAINFGLLFIFKYLNFFSLTMQPFFGLISIDYEPLNIILPMGISFYTFQAAAYTIDVYKEKIIPERNFLMLTLFITFFPQLVAGPIERTEKLLPQLKEERHYDFNNIVEGVKIMLIGFFKKVVIADRLAIIVDTVYNTPNSYEGLHFIIATVLFAFQIYCDFSGYSDIAKGCAKVFGIDLMVNFDRPYFSKSIREFWSRWHISLSTWLRDYLYIPLGGNRVSKPRHYFNLMVTFLVSGVWHGANWTFIVWGGIHGLYQIIGLITLKKRNTLKEKFTSKISKKIFGILSVFITFVLVTFAWILFRSNNIYDSFYIIGNLFSGISNWLNIQYLYEVINSFSLSLFEVIIAFLTVFMLIIIELLEKKEKIYILLSKYNIVVRFAFYYVIVLILLTLGVYHNASQFIYFQF